MDLFDYVKNYDYAYWRASDGRYKKLEKGALSIQHLYRQETI